MMSDAPPSIRPDAAAIEADLRHFYGRFATLGVPCWFELRAFTRGGSAHANKFRPDDMGIELAVEWAVTMNGLGRNVYGVRNAIRDDVRGSAGDADIIAAFFLWADCDDDGSTETVRRFDGPRPNAIVRTGRTPGERVHTYWELEEPCVHMPAWGGLQRAIAAHFGSDDKVVNPSRIMRIAGTVTYPDERKRERGYTSEIAGLRVLDREPLAFERALRVWPGRTNAEIRPAAEFDGGGMFAFDAGPQPLDRERARIQALSGQEWHDSVIRLVASYVAKGLADAEIHALTDPLTLAGYTVEQTRREVQTAIDGARRKGWTPEPQGRPADAFDFKPAGEGEAKTWRIQSVADFIADFVAPEWLVEGIVQRGRLYTCTAPTGHAKTAFWLYVSAQISQGGHVCGLDTEPGDVLFLAGENPDDVRARMIVALDRYGIDPAACRIHFIPGTFSIRQDMERLAEAAAQLPDLALIVVDTFAAYFDGDDENSNAQALDFARVVRALTMLPSRPAVVMPAHPVKNAGKGALIPKGGSSLLNEVDGNLTLWKDEAVATLHWQGKIRGPDFEPIKVEIQTATHSKVHDKRGVLMPSVVALPVLEMRAEALARESMSREDAVLLSIADAPGLSSRERASRCGLSGTGALSRILERLNRARLVRKKHREWTLTSDGEDAVDAIRSGRSGAESLED